MAGATPVKRRLEVVALRETLLIFTLCSQPDAPRSSQC